MDMLLNILIAQLPDTLVYLISIPPITPNVWERYPHLKPARITAYNQGLRELAAKHAVYYLDVYSVLVNQDGYTDKRYAAYDGYHLKTEGYKALADYIYTHALPILTGTDEPKP